VKLWKTRLRLERAEMHRARFAELWHAFLEQDDPYAVIVRVEGDGHGVIEAWPNGLPSDELGLEFGELLYQLRAALDSLVYEVAIIDSGKDPPPDAERLEFPILPSKSSFDNAARKIRPLTDQHREMIESVQTYQAANQPPAMQIIAATLESINDLARKDRHRSLRVIASWTSNKNPQIETLPDGCRVEWITATPDGPLGDDGVVARFKIDGWRSDMELEANPNLAIDVTIDDAAPPTHDADTLSRRVRMMIVVVEEIIKGFEKTLP
jgi:hypothetical protein